MGLDKYNSQVFAYAGLIGDIERLPPEPKRYNPDASKSFDQILELMKRFKERQTEVGKSKWILRMELV